MNDAPIQIHGPALRHARKAAGRSGRSVATAVGVSPPFLSYIERGVQRSVQPDVFDRLVQELSLDDPRVIRLDPYRVEDALPAA